MSEVVYVRIARHRKTGKPIRLRFGLGGTEQVFVFGSRKFGQWYEVTPRLADLLEDERCDVTEAKIFQIVRDAAEWTRIVKKEYAAELVAAQAEGDEEEPELPAVQRQKSGPVPSRYENIGKVSEAGVDVAAALLSKDLPGRKAKAEEDEGEETEAEGWRDGEDAAQGAEEEESEPQPAPAPMPAARRQEAPAKEKTERRSRRRG